MVLADAVQATIAKRASHGWLRCLIVADRDHRRRVFAEAAADAGWIAVECADVAVARDCWRRTMVQLAMIDLDGAAGEAGQQLREFVEALSRESGILSIVCGREGKPQEEIWARQLGIWLYLPGVVPSSDLTVLCGEARHLTERLAATRGTAGRVPQWSG